MMSKDDLRIIAPAIFAEQPVAEASKHYTFIPTVQLIDDFAKLGWYVVRSKQQRSHVDPIHTKHQVVFRSDAFPAVNGLFPELIMVNSHNRTAAFAFMLGLFRLICTNGLVAVDKVFESLRVRHIGYEFAALEELTQGIMENMPKVMEVVNRLQSLTLSEDAQYEFALQAVAVRFKEYVDERTKKVNTAAIEKAIDIPTLLKSQRDEDNDPTIWAVYNRIQEKLMKGGFQRIGAKDNISKSVRPVSNIKLDIDINRTLWEMANNYALTAAG